MARPYLTALMVSIPLLVITGCGFGPEKGTPREIESSPVADETDLEYQAGSVALDRLEREVAAGLERLRPCALTLQAKVSRKKQTLADISTARTLLEQGGTSPLETSTEILDGARSVMREIRYLANLGNYVVVFESTPDLELRLEESDETELERIEHLCSLCNWSLEVAGRILIVRWAEPEQRELMVCGDSRMEHLLSVLRADFGAEGAVETTQSGVEELTVTVPSGKYLPWEAVACACEQLDLLVLWDLSPYVTGDSNSPGALDDDALECWTYNLESDHDDMEERFRYMAMAWESFRDDGDTLRAKEVMDRAQCLLMWRAEVDADLEMLRAEVARRQ